MADAVDANASGHGPTIDRAGSHKVQGVADTVQGSDRRDVRAYRSKWLCGQRARGQRMSDSMTRVRQPIVKVITTAMLACLLAATPAVGRRPPGRGGHAAPARPARPRSSATPPPDPTTAAWQSTLASEGVAYTAGHGLGVYGSETVTLPALTSGSSGQLQRRGHRRRPGRVRRRAAATPCSPTSPPSASARSTATAYPSPALGQTAVTGASQTLDNTTAHSPRPAWPGCPASRGPIPFAAGTFGTPATAGGRRRPFTPVDR